MSSHVSRPLLVLSALVLSVCPGVLSQAPPLPANATVYASGLNGPRGLAFGPDGLLYVAEAGTGGTVSTKGSCTQVPAPVGPYLGGNTARISRFDSNGNRTTLAHGLPSAADAIGDLAGVADLAFIGNNLYALLAAGGCSHGNPTLPNGIVRVDLKSGDWRYITDLSTFYRQHPANYVDAGDFEADGEPYSLIVFNDALFSVEANHGQVVRTSTDGLSTLILDISKSEGHIVPTSIAAANSNLYVGNLGPFPIVPAQERVLTLSHHLDFLDTTPGLATPAYDLTQFRIASSRAGFTSILGMKFGPDGLLYALEFSDAPGNPTPGAGKVVRLTRSGAIEDVVTGLVVPTGMTFGPDHALYISNFGAAPAGAGQILRISVQF